MAIQETIIELFREQRIDKPAAYRLLVAESKADRPVTSGQGGRVRVRLPAGWEAQALTTWVYFVHVVTGVQDLEIDCIDRDGAHAVSLHVDDQQTPFALYQSLGAELALGKTRTEGAAAFAWITGGATEPPNRTLVARCLADDAEEKQPGVELEISARPGAEGATRVEDWADTLIQFHDVMWQAPHMRFAELDRLPPRHKKLIADYNATTAYLPPACTLPALLNPVLASEQQHVAIHTTRGDRTYEQYRVGAYRLAHLLRQRGVKPNDRVAVIMHRTADMPVALYGVVCSGAAYVPLEPDLPLERVRTILRDTGARIVVTDADTLYAKHIQFGDCGVERLVCTDPWPRGQYSGLPVDDARALAQSRGSEPTPVNGPDDICYVIYTSGSTGQPKGVMVGHQAIVNTLIGVNNVFRVGRQDRVLCFSSYGFDLSVWDMFGTALARATLVLPSKMEKADPPAMMRLLREAEVTLWDSAPTGMSQLLQAFEDQPVSPVPSVRAVLLGGEFIARKLVDDIQRFFPNSKLANMGGNTEAAVYSVYHYPVTSFEPHWKSIPYGVPLANQRLYVLNESLQPCPIGEKGMIYIGGLGVALGYLGDLEKTRKAFLPSPWNDGPGKRIYRTGDLGIMRADGVIEISGRADRQVKLRGYRIELGEIETRLNAIDGITHGAIIAKRDESNQMRLLAFYVSRHGEIPAEQLRAQLSEKLPEYMIPSRFVHLVDPPIGATGKLDRKALEARDVSRDDMGQKYTQPRGEIEQALVREIARMLRLDRVGVDDDFFLIGGDSLLTLQYLAALSRLGFSARPADITEGRTVRGVLERVSLHVKTDEAAHDVIAFSPMGRKFLERWPLANRDHWHQLMMIRFDHEPDLPRLQRAMQAVVHHHPLLRARYQADGLHVGAPAPFVMEVKDLRRTSRFRRGARLEEVVKELRATVTLSSRALSNAVLVHMGPRDVRLLWVLHHLVVDANCWRILMDDLATAYRDQDARLLRAASMADFVSGMRAGAAEAVRQLAARPPYRRMPIPKCLPEADGHPPATGTEGSGRTLRLVLPPKETRTLFDTIQNNSQVNLHLMLLTALSLALRKWTGSPDVKFDIISNARSAVENGDYSRTIGWFATHNPFEILVPEDAPTALRQVTAAWTSYQESSRFFVEVCNDVKGRRDHPLDAHVDQPLLYSFLGDFDSLDLPEGWWVLGSVGRNRAPENPRTHELEMEALVARGCLMVRVVYPDGVVPRGKARELLKAFRASLRTLVADLEPSPRAPAALPRLGPLPAAGH